LYNGYKNDQAIILKRHYITNSRKITITIAS